MNLVLHKLLLIMVMHLIKVSTEIEKLNQKLSELTNSINHLTVNKEPLETAKISYKQILTKNLALMV